MKKLLKLLIPVLVFVISLNTHAQTLTRLRSVMSAGGSSEAVFSGGRQYILQHCIGQPGITGLVQYKDHQLRQGFIQPPAGSADIISRGLLEATVFPNPVSGNIFISFSEEISDCLYITLYDLNGRIIYFGKHEAAACLILDAGDLASGVYIIRISSTTKYLSAKVIKL